MTGDRAGVIDDATSVLLLAPAVRDAAAGAAAKLLEKDSQTHDRVVAVTFSQSAESWTRVWDRHVGVATNVSCIDVDCGTRAASADGGSAAVPVERVAKPADLKTLGRTVSNVLEQASDRGERVGLAIHSLTDLVHHVDEPTAFKFVYTLGEVVRRVEGTVYFHLDPGAHDDESIDTFAAACDAVVDIDDDGVTVTPQNEW
jgi:hypothetical protein